MQMVRVLGISGSSRPGGNTSILIEEALEGAKDFGADIEFLELAPLLLNPCLHRGECYELGHCHQDDDLNRVVERMYAADGIIVGSPVHFGSVTASMKNFMDRCGRFAHLEGKVGCSIAVTNRSGADLTVSQMLFFLLVKEMIVPGGMSWPIGMALNIGDIRSDVDAMDMAKQMGRRVANLADILVKVPVAWRYEPRLPDAKARFGDEWRSLTSD
ncbi:MAG: flavodoxin family protein [Candidatus Hermodarchaeota archaeon]